MSFRTGLGLAGRVGTVALVSILTVVTLSVPAYAGHGGDGPAGIPDNTLHCVDRNGVTAKVDDAVQHGVAQIDRSDMDARLSCSGDVEVYDAYYGTSGDWNDAAAKVNCEVWTDTYPVCDIFRVRYNLSYFANYSSDMVKSGGCHEFGHTAGLKHRTDANDDYDNSCMWAELSGGRRNFDSHDIDAINYHV